MKTKQSHLTSYGNFMETVQSLPSLLVSFEGNVDYFHIWPCIFPKPLHRPSKRSFRKRFDPSPLERPQRVTNQFLRPLDPPVTGGIIKTGEWCFSGYLFPSFNYECFELGTSISRSRSEKKGMDINTSLNCPSTGRKSDIRLRLEPWADLSRWQISWTNHAPFNKPELEDRLEQHDGKEKPRQWGRKRKENVDGNRQEREDGKQAIMSPHCHGHNFISRIPPS